MSADEHPAGTDPLELALAEAGYVPLLSRDGGVSATVIARQLRVRGERTVATEVWRRTFEDPQEASVHHAWLRGSSPSVRLRKRIYPGMWRRSSSRRNC